MSSYILLRNKVESKSLSLEELQAIGMRSTDLIWVECQSWDWQRPQEIPELKMLLGSQPKNVVSPVITGAATTHEPLLPLFVPSAGQSTSAEKPAVLRVRKTILPEPESNVDADKSGLNSKMGATGELENISEKNSAAYSLEKQEPATVANFAPVLPNEKQSFKDHDHETNSINEHISSKQQDATTSLQTNYSRSLDEIKELYVRNLVKKDKHAGETKIWSPALLKKAAVYIGFAIAGAMLVLLTSNKSDKKNIALGSPDTAIVQTESDTGFNQPVETVTDLEPVAETDIPATGEIISPAPQEKRSYEEPARIVVEKKPIEEPVEKAGKEVASETPEQPEAVIPGKLILPADISSQLTLRANEYVTGSFGGIRDLKMTLKNDSKYMLDLVRVEINYLNLDHITVHKEQVVFRSVDAGKSETIAVKKSRRGVRIKYKITTIESGDVARTAGF